MIRPFGGKINFGGGGWFDCGNSSLFGKLPKNPGDSGFGFGETSFPRIETVFPRRETMMPWRETVFPSGDLWFPRGESVFPSGDARPPGGETGFPRGDARFPLWGRWFQARAFFFHPCGVVVPARDGASATCRKLRPDRRAMSGPCEKFHKMALPLREGSGIRRQPRFPVRKPTFCHDHTA